MLRVWDIFISEQNCVQIPGLEFCPEVPSKSLKML